MPMDTYGSYGLPTDEYTYLTDTYVHTGENSFCGIQLSPIRDLSGAYRCVSIRQ